MTPLAKRLSIALAISIAVNLLFAGLMVGRALHRPHPPPFAGRERAFDGAHEGKGPLRGLLREHGDALRQKRRAMSDARRTATAALEKEPFDRAALERALEELRKETVASQEIMHRAIADAASKGSVDERLRLANALLRASLRSDVGRGPGPERGR